jgi:Domain of unknown function (DUF4395)
VSTQQILSDQPRPSAKPFDRTAVRFNQALIIAFLALGFILNQPLFVALVTAVMTIGTAFPSAALFQRFYRDLLRPAKLLQPDVHAEDAAPHRFAQGMGAGVLILSLIAFLTGSVVVGWALTMLVIVLAAINLFFGFCAGCFVFFQLQRLGVIGH